MEKNIDDDDNDDDVVVVVVVVVVVDYSSGKFMKYFIFQIWIMLIFSSLLQKKISGFALLCNIGISGMRSMANFVKWWDLELSTSDAIHRI